MKITVRVNDRPAQGFFRSLQRNHRNLAPYWKLASISYYQFVQKGFDKEGHPEAWKPLSPATITRRRKGKNRAGGLRVRILRDTGQLLRSATHPDGAGYREIHPDHMIIGSNLRYAKYHHDGTRNMPRRRFFQFDNTVLARMGDVMNRAALRDAQR